MKKITIGVTILLIIIFISSFYGYSVIINTSEEIVNKLEAVEYSLNKKDWVEAQLRANKLNKEWERVKRIWTPLMDHTEVDRTDILIARSIKLVQLESQVKSLEKIAAAKVMIKNIGEGQKPNIQNIF
ncbi:DUF4363 family protein [Halonatronum saccharophilum]|uniref:DUF4363 family protein n=1 Tax=Halonatronum saccharophilum TaxID=150060 RepID=UPI000484F05D|nr:DUF4363 family protein [Halonatronum saccharophilum]